MSNKKNFNNFDNLYLESKILIQNKKYSKAEKLLKKILEFHPYFFEGHYNRGVLLQELKKFSSALESFDKAIQINPNYFWAYFKKANILQLINNFKDSILYYSKAINLNPKFSEAYYNRALSFYNLRKLDQSLKDFTEAISLKNDFAEAYYNRAIVLADQLSDFSLDNARLAMSDFDKAILINPNYYLAYASKADLLDKLNLKEESILMYEKALKIKPDLDLLRGSYLRIKMSICDWSDLDLHIAKSLNDIFEKKITIDPFSLLLIDDKLSTQLVCTQTFVKKKYPKENILNSIPKCKNLKKIRIGYFSSDFHDHPVSHLMIEIFKSHSRNIFEVFAFSLVKKKNKFREQLISCFDKFIDVDNLDDFEISKLSRKYEINIAVDLTGHTSNNRFKIFSYRLAPIQVNFLGYPGSSGSDYIDYIIADKIVIPIEYKKFYTEKICYLPNSFFPFSRIFDKAKKIFLRKDLDLPDNAFVFASFNNSFKISPNIFSAWMSILKSVDNSVLWLSKNNERSLKNIIKEAKKYSIETSRIVFAEKLECIKDHFARHQNIDLFLDTFPYGGHTTSINALWSGIPLLTMQGETFASRVASSMLNSIGLSELITNSFNTYEAKAIELANNPKKLSEIKNKIENSISTASLFNSEIFTTNLENAYVKMFERYKKNLKPNDIFV